MIYKKLSKRQLLALTWWRRPAFKHLDGIICDGSIRSGKTISMSVGFVMWAMAEFDGALFAICGKTIESLRRNVITQLPTWLEGVVTIKERRNENKLIVTVNGRTNSFHLFGGRDESSYTLIQGITLAGVLFDEVALMPRSFVEQAMARCSVDGSKFWFNCNPEGPSHWFYQEWVLKPKERRILHLHFTMEDNRSLSEAIKARYESMYTGVFYDRYIRGRWVVAEGLIYTCFNPKLHVVPTQERAYDKYYISCDYGTINPFSCGLWGMCAGKWYRISEYYYNSRAKENNGRQQTDAEYYDQLIQLAGDRKVTAVIVDPSAASFIETIRRGGRFRVEPASNSVLDGIRDVSTQLQQGKLLFNDCCRDCIREFDLYRWDEKAPTDKPLKTDDHSMDDVRYFVHTAFAPARFSF